MKNLFSYNLITILNCAKIKALTGKSLNFSNFYQVDFDELEELEIENVIKAIGLYPVPFFSLKTTDSPISIKEALPIKNLWHSLHFANHIHGTTHALTLTSQVNNPHNLHETICLTDEHWSLLSAKNRENISNIRYAFMRIGQSKSNLPPPACTPNRLKSPIERLIQTKLPHTIVSALSGLSLSHIKNLRETLIENGLFLPKTSVQKRHLERHSFDRFVLFVAVCYFDLQLYLGHSPIESYLNTIHVFDHAPTVLANKTEECHLAVNLYHWLTAHGKLPIYGENFQISSPDHFPENFRDLFDFRTLTKVPAIREMGTFSIPECLDLEHKHLLDAINQAILEKTCLKTVLHNYFDGRYA